tara:strand:- start:13711 stop:14115 length:405 start_codon:yes stop_codon:yes gene_type:complete
LDKSCIYCLYRIFNRRKSKKLKEAVLYWLGVGNVIDETTNDAKAFGIELPKKEEKKEEVFEVYDDNWDAVEMFIKAQTQWQTSAGGFVGLKYEIFLMQGGLFDLYNIKDRTKILEELQIMESYALPELNKESKK